MRAWGLALLLAACGGGTPTHATAFPIPAETHARWPACSLDGWTLELVPEPFTPPPYTVCGTTYCTGKVRGYTNTRTRTIKVWANDPHIDAVKAWEACAACKWEETRVLEDKGCT